MWSERMLVASRCLLALLGLLVVSLASAPGILAGSEVAITISGAVTGPHGPESGVWLGIGSPEDWQETTTDGSGFYSVSLETSGQVWFHVRPPEPSGLAWLNHYADGVTGSFIQDFTVEDGYLLSLQILDGGAAPVPGPLNLEVLPLQDSPPEGWWHSLEWDGGLQRHRAVLPPDIYHVTVLSTVPGHYPTGRSFDLREADVDADIPLNTDYVHPIPYDPPDASKITFSSPDDLGEVDVTGGSGAALPLARILLVNLNSNHQAHTVSEADGSFAAGIYAPPGSAVMVKHGPASHRWNALENGLAEGVNPFPGTIINLPHTHAGGGRTLPFAAVGGIDIRADDPAETRNYVGSAWAITGTVRPVVEEGEWTRVLDGLYEGEPLPGLYSGGLNWTHPALADLDDDGDLDLLVGEERGRVWLFRNQGVPSAPDWQFETAAYAGVDTGWWAYPALADVTGDGAPDLFVGSGEGKVAIYYNDGTPAEPLWPSLPDSLLETGIGAAPALAHLDADDDLDLLVGHEGGALELFRNTGTPTAPAWTHETGSYGGISEPGHGLQPSLVDLDGDDDLDLLIGRTGDLVWYRNNGPPSGPIWTREQDGYMGFGGSSAVSPSTGDWDDDADLDLITGEHWGVLRLFRNEGPPTWPEMGLRLPLDLAGDTAPALADWDGDGDPDLLLGQVHGDVHAYTNAGTAAEPDWQPGGITLSLPSPDHPHAFPTLADVDGDGDHDLFVGQGGWQGPGAGGNIHYYRNDGTPSAASWISVTGSFLGLDVGGWSTPVFADINGDGDLDLFVGDEAGTLTYVENTGIVTSPVWAAPVQPYAGLHLGEFSAPSFFDVDDDGDLDMLVGLGSGSLAYVRNEGTEGSPTWELVSTSYQGLDVGEHAVPAAADVDGDGMPDLLLGDGDGGLNLYLYEGPGVLPGPDDVYAPGDRFQVEGTLRLYGPAIGPATDLNEIAAPGWMSLMMLFDGDGLALAPQNQFMSTMLTPTGLPVQRVEQPRLPLHVHVSAENLRHPGGHVIEGDLAASGRLPEDLPPGIYRPIISFDFSGVPTSTQWLAANVVHKSYAPNEAALPPMTVGDVAPPRLIWHLLADDAVQGTRGTGAREDQGAFGLASQIATQGAPYHTPPIDVRTGQPLVYRLAPFLPALSSTDRRLPSPPLIPLDLPGGQLQVEIREPDGTLRDLGGEALAQSSHRTKTTRWGLDLNIGTVQLDDLYSLQAGSDRFEVAFDQYGRHTIDMTGNVSDLWGNTYAGGGTYDVWIAHTLDIDPGVLPGTPLAVGDAFNPALQLYPRVPAEIHLTLTLHPNSDPAQAEVQTVTGMANRFGYFSVASDSSDLPPVLSDPGEYRVDLTAIYTATTGEVYMGAMTWGGVVMTPATQADLVAHGRSGLDSLTYIPNRWFVSSDLTIPQGAVSHTWNPYYNGDVLWSRMSDGAYGGDSLQLGASVDDPLDTVKAAIQARAARMTLELTGPGTFEERVAVGELPLFSSTRSGRPAQLFLRQIGTTLPVEVDQIAYSYRSSQRPGVRVRELVQDGESIGYWRLDTLYDDQLGVGVLGDQPNDFKFQYVGTVYRDLDTGRNEYAGQGTGWVFIPDSDATGSRVMPPFAGPGNGGWTTLGGPLLTLKGQDVHLFILPTGTLPGVVLHSGDTFRFAGHIMPTLDSRVAVTVTAPSGAQHWVDGLANSVGYFYDRDDDFTVTEPGLWAVDVHVWHDGQCSGGSTVPPYPSGDVLGSDAGRYWFYVVPIGSPRLAVDSPAPGFLSHDGEVAPNTITGTVPGGLAGVTVDYTIGMPGLILEQGQVIPGGDTYQITFDPATLQADFPNLDLVGRDGFGPGLADTFAIGLLLRGQRQALAAATGDNTIYMANTLTIQGDQVFVGDARLPHEVYLPVVLRAPRDSEGRGW
jgi:hypothetical protein